MHIIAIVNQKGGCGKTTTAINLAGVFAGQGRRTLLVDLDPQSHCAAGLAIPENRIDLNIGDAMTADPGSPVDSARLLWRVSRNLDLAPSTLRLAALEAARGELAGQADAERRLAGVLARLDGQYDVCLIDCSPAIGLLAFNALVAAHEVLIPVETGFFSLTGATKQVNTIKAIGKRLGVAPVHRLLPTMHEPTSALSTELLEELRRRFTTRVIPVVIRLDQKLREASSSGQPVIEYDADSTGARDYRDLAAWLTANSLTREPAAAPPPEPVAVMPVAVPPPPPGNRAAEMADRARRLQHARAADEADALPIPALPAPRQIEVKSIGLAPSIPSAPAARFGPQVTPSGIIFRAPASLGRNVAVAGDFNGWVPDRTQLRPIDAAGTLEAAAFLTPGSTSQYRLVIDGHWVADPYNPCSVPNPFGGINSVVSVPIPAAEPMFSAGAGPYALPLTETRSCA